MRIGIVVRVLWPTGAPKAAAIQTRVLEKLGYEATLFYLRDSSFTYDYSDLIQGLDYHILHPKHSSWRSRFYDWGTGFFLPDRVGDGRLDFDLLKRFYKDISSFPIDHLICHDQWAGIAGLYAKKRVGIPYSVFVHERLSEFATPILGRLASRWETKSLEGATVLFAPTQKIAQSIQSKYPQLASRIVMNIHGMDWRDEHEEVGRQGREKSIIVDSMWDEGRRPLDYLSIANSLPEYKLRFCGHWRSSALRARFIDAATSSKLENVSLHQGLSESALMEMYRQSRFMVRFGFGEWGVGASVLQAVQSLTPVIVNAELGTADIIARLGGGAVVRTMDEVPGAVRAMDNDARFRQLQNELTQIRATYTWERHVKNLVSAIGG